MITDKTSERVRQIQNQALAKLKQLLADESGFTALNLEYTGCSERRSGGAAILHPRPIVLFGQHQTRGVGILL